MAKKPPLTNSQKVKSNTAIHTASAAAAGSGAGLAQLPMSDNVPLIAIQITMAISLGNIFEIELSDSAARGLIMTTLASMTGPVLARAATQWLVGWWPGAGNAINATTAAGLTEALGWVLVKEFHRQYLEMNAEQEEE